MILVQENPKLYAHLGKLSSLLFTVLCRSACCDIEMLVKMLDAGMNVARIDFSEGDFQTHDNNLAALGAARKQRPEKNCAVLLETKGPRICSGFLKD